MLWLKAIYIFQQAGNKEIGAYVYKYWESNGMMEYKK